MKRLQVEVHVIQAIATGRDVFGGLPIGYECVLHAFLYYLRASSSCAKTLNYLKTPLFCDDGVARLRLSLARSVTSVQHAVQTTQFVAIS